jgi:hypothetical protein
VKTGFGRAVGPDGLGQTPSRDSGFYLSPGDAAPRYFRSMPEVEYPSKLSGRVAVAFWAVYVAFVLGVLGKLIGYLVR